jgi:hypothetical protein
MALPFIVWALIFVFAYTQSPLYTSNQNQYFLQGLANAGQGFLQQDWLANTFDPTPVFSLFVQAVARFLHPWFFYLFAALLIGFYFWFLVQIVSSLRDRPRSRTEQAIFLSILILIHSAAWRFAISRSLGANWSYVLEDGFAGQRLLGPVLQPSMFGVLLLASIWCYLQKKPFLAVLASGAAATIHPTYLLSAAALTLAYMIAMFLEPVPSGETPFSRRRLVKIFLVGLCSFIVVLPIVSYAYLTFGTTPAATTAEARRILVDFRIPHHVQPEVWFDGAALVKLIILATAIWVARKSRLAVLLIVPAIVGFTLSLVYVVTRNDFLGLLFPWRLSVFLVPISSAILVDQLVRSWQASSWMKSLTIQRWSLRLAIVLAVLALFVGITRQVLDFQRQAVAPEHELFTFVNDHLQEGQVVLAPVKMQEFRLATGSPVFVDFKSIPYRDLDVLEWYRRIKVADAFYKNPDCTVLASLVEAEAITQIVLPAGKLMNGCDFLTREYQDSTYEIYGVR